MQRKCATVAKERNLSNTEYICDTQWVAARGLPIRKSKLALMELSSASECMAGGYKSYDPGLWNGKLSQVIKVNAAIGDGNVLSRYLVFAPKGRKSEVLSAVSSPLSAVRRAGLRQ
jgi:hypothetical protein